MAPLGLIGVGFGASAVARAATKWAQGRPYFLHGTFALVCLNASLSVFGDAVKHRALYEMKTGAGPGAMLPNPRTQDRHSGTL